MDLYLLNDLEPFYDLITLTATCAACKKRSGQFYEAEHVGFLEGDIPFPR